MNQIAVVIPVYNGEHTIQKSITSLINQSFQDWNAVVVNDGSTDNTLTLLNQIKDSRINVISYNINKGRAYARQKALDYVVKNNFKYMCMLDADDIYLKDKLEFQFAFMEEHTNVALMSTSLGICNTNNKLYRVLEPFNKVEKFILKAYEDYKEVPHATSIIRVCKIDNNISFDLKFKFGEDQDFMRRLLFQKEYIFYPKITYLYNRDDSFSLKKYYKSTVFRNISISNLPIPLTDKKVAILKNNLKFCLVFMFVFLGLKKMYLNRMGRLPKQNELI